MVEQILLKKNKKGFPHVTQAHPLPSSTNHIHHLFSENSQSLHFHCPADQLSKSTLTALCFTKALTNYPKSHTGYGKDN